MIMFSLLPYHLFMSNPFDKLQPAVKKESLHVLIYTGVGVFVMFVIFLIAHLIVPEKVPFDYTVFLGGLVGGLVAFLNFFLMALTVQRVASETDEEAAKKLMKLSYSRRLAFQLIWIVISVLVPCFNLIAGIAPLLFPGAGIKLCGILQAKKG